MMSWIGSLRIVKTWDGEVYDPSRSPRVPSRDPRLQPIAIAGSLGVESAARLVC